MDELNKEISFVTAFRVFDGVFGPIQKSALYSYQANNIAVYGANTEPGVEAACVQYPNVKLFRNVKTGKDIGFKNSSPLVRDLLLSALCLVKTPFVGLINSDVMIPEGFMNLISPSLHKYGSKLFVAVTRQDITLSQEVDSIEKLRDVFNTPAQMYDEWSSSDLFIASRETFQDIACAIPNFILGRYAWDNWLHYYAVTTPGIIALNGTKKLPILHCRHTHDHIKAQEGAAGKGAPSSAHNIALLQKMQDNFGSSPRINFWESL